MARLFSKTTQTEGVTINRRPSFFLVFILLAGAIIRPTRGDVTQRGAVRVGTGVNLATMEGGLLTFSSDIYVDKITWDSSFIYLVNLSVQDAFYNCFAVYVRQGSMVKFLRANKDILSFDFIFTETSVILFQLEKTPTEVKGVSDWVYSEKTGVLQINANTPRRITVGFSKPSTVKPPSNPPFIQLPLPDLEPEPEPESEPVEDPTVIQPAPEIEPKPEYTEPPFYEGPPEIVDESKEEPILIGPHYKFPLETWIDVIRYILLWLYEMYARANGWKP